MIKMNNTVYEQHLYRYPKTYSKVAKFDPIKTKGYLALDTETDYEFGSRKIEFAQAFDGKYFYFYVNIDELEKRYREEVRVPQFYRGHECIPFTSLNSFKNFIQRRMIKGWGMYLFNSLFDLGMLADKNVSIDVDTNTFILRMFENSPVEFNIRRLAPFRTMLNVFNTYENDDGDSIRRSRSVIDTQTASSILTGKYSLDKTCEFFKIERKTEKLTGINSLQKFIIYSLNDAYITYQLGERLRGFAGEMGLDIELSRLVSPATITKYLLSSMNVERTHVEESDVAERMFELLNGGWTEATIRSMKFPFIKATYGDFKSQYPELILKLGLWKFISARSIGFQKVTDKANRVFNSWAKHWHDPSFIAEPENWKNLVIIADCYLKNVILPVRVGTSLYFAELSGRSHVLFPDLIGGYLYSKYLGLNPEVKIREAYEPIEERNNGLVSIQFGDDYIDPYDELSKVLMDRRARCAREHPHYLLYKLAGNSLYGVLAQREFVKDPDTGEKILIGGAFFNPVCGFITSGAHLLLYLGRAKLLKDGRGDSMYCDTDSLFCFRKDYEYLAEYFKKCIPFEIKGEGDLVTLSSKRWAMYKNGKISQKEYSRHGLGMYLKEDEVLNVWQLYHDYYLNGGSMYEFQKQLKYAGYDKQHLIKQLTLATPFTWIDMCQTMGRRMKVGDFGQRSVSLAGDAINFIASNRADLEYKKNPLLERHKILNKYTKTKYTAILEFFTHNENKVAGRKTDGTMVRHKIHTGCLRKRYVTKEPKLDENGYIIGDSDRYEAKADEYGNGHTIITLKDETRFVLINANRKDLGLFMKKLEPLMKKPTESES